VPDDFQAFLGAERRDGIKATTIPLMMPTLYPAITRKICVKVGNCIVMIADAAQAAMMSQTVPTITSAERKLLAIMPNNTLVKTIMARLVIHL